MIGGIDERNTTSAAGRFIVRTMQYLRNVWYPAGWATELTDGKLVARRLLDEPIVLYRDSTGQPVALADRCPHRFASLSLGKLVGGALQCGYHGLRFDSTGRCIHNPHGPAPSAARVRNYPLVERYSVLWIWMGDAARADAALIPDFSFMDPQHWHVGTSSMVVEAPYELESDNILDLSHIEYLHPILASDRVHTGKFEATHTGDTVWSKRLICGEDLHPFLRDAFQIPPGQLADRWLDVRWDAPASLALWSGAVPAGAERSPERAVPTAHLFAPQDARSTHYFFSICFPQAMGPFGATLARDQIAALEDVFRREDKPMIEAQARNIGDAEFDSLKPVLFGMDSAAARARQILARRIRQEAGQ